MKSTREFRSEELNMDQFSESLNQWGKDELEIDETNSENITKAKEKILEAYQGYLDDKASSRNKGFSSFRSLELSNLGLNSLPDVIFEIKDLSSLDIGNNWSSNRAQDNKISQISPLIANLKKLRTFTFHYNQISKLPDAIGELTELKELRGQYNLLTSLPKSIGDLIKLETIFLPNNKIISIPEEIKYCPIRFLSLNGNNLTDLAILRISYIKTLTALGIQANHDLSINPEFYNNLRGKMEALDAMNARNEYHLTNLINKMISKQDNPLVIWTLNQFIFSKEKQINPQNLFQSELQLVENTSNFFNLLTRFYQSDYFQGLNRDQKDSISQALSKILVKIYERRDDEIFLQEVNNFAEKNFQAIANSAIKFVGAIYKIKNLCDDKGNFQLSNQTSKEDLLKHLKDQVLNSYIEDLIQRKKIGNQRLSRFSDLEIYETLIREFNEKFDCNILSFEEINIPNKEAIKSFFPDLLDIELLSENLDAQDLENLTPEEKILALQSRAIAKELFENPNSNIFGIKDHDLLNSLNDFKNFLDKISGIAILEIQNSNLAIDQKNTSIALINDQKIKEFTKILFLKLKEINSSNLDLSSIIYIQLLHPAIGDHEQELIKTKFRFLVSNAVKTLNDSDQTLAILKQFRDETSNIKLPENSAIDIKLPENLAINISSTPQARAFGPDLESPQDISARISRQNQEIKLAEEEFNQRMKSYFANKAIDDQVRKIELELDGIKREIDEALLENSKKFLDVIFSEIEEEQFTEKKDQEIAQEKIKAIEVASTLTLKIFDKELKEVEESFVSSQLDLVETKISEIESKIAESQIAELQKKWAKISSELSSENDPVIADEKVNQVKGVSEIAGETGGEEVAREETVVSGNDGYSTVSGRRSSGDGLQTGDSPGKSPSPSVAELIGKFEPNKHEDSLRRASCCPINIRGPKVRSLIEKFSRIANWGRGN